MSPAAMQQALDAIEGSGCKADLMAAADALRAALAEQSQPVAWAEQIIEHLTALHNTEMIRELDSGDALIRLDDAIAAVDEARDRYTPPPAPQALTIERLRDALVASRVIDLGAVEDPEGFDDGVMLARIEALFRRIA